MTRTWWTTQRSSRASSTECKESIPKRLQLHPWPNQTLWKSWCQCDKKYTQVQMLSSSWIDHLKCHSQPCRCRSLHQHLKSSKGSPPETWRSSLRQDLWGNSGKNLLKVKWWLCHGSMVTDQILAHQDQLHQEGIRPLHRSRWEKMLVEVWWSRTWDENKTGLQCPYVEA